MSYKLFYQHAGVLRLADGAIIPNDDKNRDWRKYRAWLDAGNTPEPADEPTAEELARQDEIRQAGPTARDYFRDNPAAIAFIRKSPEEQEAQIRLMTPLQKDALLVYLAVAVSAMVKERFAE